MRRGVAAALCASLPVILLTATTCCSAPKVVKEVVLPAFDGRPSWPRFAGDWVIAQQIKSTKTDEGRKSTVLGILAYNVVTGEVYTAWNGPTSWPDAGGNVAVWTGRNRNIETFRTFNGEPNGRTQPSPLIVCDPSTWCYYCPRLTTTGGCMGAPTIWGNYAAYLGRGRQVYVIDMTTGAQWPVSTGDHQKRSPQLGKDLVVWEALIDQQQIHACRISTKREFAITDDPGAEYLEPRTDGNTVVWHDRNNVYVYDVATRERFAISGAYRPDVDQGILVYLKRIDRGHPAVYGMDLKTRAAFRISKDVCYAFPSIDNGRVVWTKSGTDNKIFYAELSVMKQHPLAGSPKSEKRVLHPAVRGK